MAYFHSKAERNDYNLAETARILQIFIKFSSNIGLDPYGMKKNTKNIIVGEYRSYSFLDNYDYIHPPAAQLYNLTSVFGRRVVNP